MSEYIAGRHAVIHALKAQRRAVHCVYFQSTLKDRDELEALARAQGVPTETVEKGFFSQKLSVQTHQGVAADVDPLPTQELADLLDKPVSGPRRLLVLDSIEDPQNFGALLRSAVAFGMEGVVWSKRHSAPLSAVAVKAAAGAVEYLQLIPVSNLAHALDELKAAEFWVYGAVAEAGQDPWSESYPSAMALVIGSEGKGIRRLVREKCDILLSIPCEGPLESLNASVAGGVLMAACASQKTST